MKILKVKIGDDEFREVETLDSIGVLADTVYCLQEKDLSGEPFLLRGFKFANMWRWKLSDNTVPVEVEFEE